MTVTKRTSFCALAALLCSCSEAGTGAAPQNTTTSQAGTTASPTPSTAGSQSMVAAGGSSDTQAASPPAGWDGPVPSVDPETFTEVPAECLELEACGGDVTGEWELVDAPPQCFDPPSYEVHVPCHSLNVNPDGSPAFVPGSLPQGTDRVATVGTESGLGIVTKPGTWRFEPSGTWQLAVPTTGAHAITFEPECLQQRSPALTCAELEADLLTRFIGEGFSSNVACQPEPTGGCGCTYDVSRFVFGSQGFYETDGENLLLTQRYARHPMDRLDARYCVQTGAAGDLLTIVSTNPRLGILGEASPSRMTFRRVEAADPAPGSTTP